MNMGPWSGVRISVSPRTSSSYQSFEKFWKTSFFCVETLIIGWPTYHNIYIYIYYSRMDVPFMWARSGSPQLIYSARRGNPKIIQIHRAWIGSSINTGYWLAYKHSGSLTTQSVTLVFNIRTYGGLCSHVEFWSSGRPTCTSVYWGWDELYRRAWERY